VSAFARGELRFATLTCPSASRRQGRQCSGSGRSRPACELTVSETFRSFRRQGDRDANDRSQGSADVARRMCVARWFPERQLNRCRGHWASKTNRMSAAHGAGLTHPTLCCPSSSPRQRQQCSGSGRSRPACELTVSETFRSFRRQRDRDVDDRSQGSADVARRMCVARWFPERQLKRCRGHWASKTNRMSAAHGAGLTHPTRNCHSRTSAMRRLDFLSIFSVSMQPSTGPLRRRPRPCPSSSLISR
jgi:hypothetical protein